MKKKKSQTCQNKFQIYFHNWWIFQIFLNFKWNSVDEKFNIFVLRSQFGTEASLLSFWAFLEKNSKRIPVFSISPALGRLIIDQFCCPFFEIESVWHGFAVGFSKGFIPILVVFWRRFSKSGQFFVRNLWNSSLKKKNLQQNSNVWCFWAVKLYLRTVSFPLNPWKSCQNLNIAESFDSWNQCSIAGSAFWENKNLKCFTNFFPFAFIQMRCCFFQECSKNSATCWEKDDIIRKIWRGFECER